MDLLNSAFTNALVTSIAMAVACAVLSVFVVCRRWAFIGEGISHAGFGGAGLAWLVALMIPALNTTWLPYVGVIVFCMATAIAIGYFSRGQRLHSDTAIGIFLVASLAFGFLAQRVYQNATNTEPHGWRTFLFGELRAISPEYTLVALTICVAVLLVVTLLGKEIVYYSFDPAMAEASGVRAGFIHYLLIILMALLIVLSVPVTGTVLATALLVLPGATALMLSQKLKSVVSLAVLIAFIGAVAGLMINRQWRFLPEGPAIVLVLFVLFIVACFMGKLNRA